ncbi:MAG: ATP synthase F0 subunit A [Pirellula sp.]|nr:ATP synthase F0 subunit A [Pirellula sp.]
MADAILHIKDTYYFEVPKVLWPAHYKTLEELPPTLAFLKHEVEESHGKFTIADVNHELSGKIVIPQPFGKLKSFYAAESGFCISKFMVIELIIAAVIVLIFTRLAPKIASGKAPKGYFWNAFEATLVFVRDGIARPAIDSHDEHDHSHHTPNDQEQEANGIGHIHGQVHHHDGDKFLPILWTMFFFILFCNLFGMLPWLGAPTGAFGVTLALACCTFATTLIAGSLKFGVVGFWKNQVPSMDLPLPIAIFLKPMIFVIEVLGLAIKHGVLAIRLLANMVAGHLVLLSILGLIIVAVEANVSSAMYGTVSVASILGSTLLSLLELFVCFLQAYVFTFLSALFIGAAVHQH